MSNPTLVLLGDSVLDNAAYTQPKPDTVAHLRRLLPDWSVALTACDGAIMGDVARQLRQLEERPSVAVLSVGGNDVVRHINVLGRPATDSGEVIDELLAIANAFEMEYERVAKAVSQKTDRLVLCTIYEVHLDPHAWAERARVPLALLNDRIIRIAKRRGAEVLELRDVCTARDDFVLQIEPSAQGARKIAEAIAKLVSQG